MSNGNYQEISISDFYQLQEKAVELGLTLEFIEEKNQVEFFKGQEWVCKISIPWSMKINESHQLEKRDDYHLAIVMIRAGIACTGYFHQGEMQDHKVFRAYMVRQKQGKSQIKYLKTKGKSRAGSRVRLGESELFFEEINERLNRYAENYPIMHWGISCSKTLWPFFFGSSTPPPFDKKQDNLIHIPFHVQHPDFETLQLMHKKVNSFHVLFSEDGEMIFNDLNKPEKKTDLDEDDW